MGAHSYTLCGVPISQVFIGLGTAHMFSCLFRMERIPGEERIRIPWRSRKTSSSKFWMSAFNRTCVCSWNYYQFHFIIIMKWDSFITTTKFWPLLPLDLVKGFIFPKGWTTNLHDIVHLILVMRLTLCWQWSTYICPWCWEKDIKYCSMI